MKAFQEILYLNKESEGTGASPPVIPSSEETGVWGVAWRVWLSIGAESTTPPEETLDAGEELYIPSQAFLTALVQIFPAVFQHIRARYDQQFLGYCVPFAGYFRNSTIILLYSFTNVCNIYVRVRVHI